MRTQQEIINRINKVKKMDFFGFEITEYLPFLNFENAKQFLKPEVTASDWKWEEPTDDVVKARMIDYMPFAWEKANGFRGLSAGRSISHYKAWLWLVGNEELMEEIEDYEYYGKPQLCKICEYLGLDSKTWDDVVRKNSEE